MAAVLEWDDFDFGKQRVESEAERVGQAAPLPTELLVHTEHNADLGSALESQRLDQTGQSSRVGRARQ